MEYRWTYLDSSTLAFLAWRLDEATAPGMISPRLVSLIGVCEGTEQIWQSTTDLALGPTLGQEWQKQQHQNEISRI